ncbi:hypothetical protein CVO77_00595 [Sphingopyxis lindanitolerans]|uniref:Uncharacterized protein n=2 Tax=Sphingopyxis lindanitolerans TaxID=2054227 RepID=A0A2S8BAM1_9SPHN|nr:hypothetical protein CVO77_00595 [Sphingopyxis lindanitolerans]
MRQIGRAVLACTALVATTHIAPGASGKESSQTDALRSAKAFADCIVKKRPEQAREVVFLSRRDVDTRFPKLLDKECLPHKSSGYFISQLRFPGETLHQMLANALIRLEYSSSGPDLSTLSPTDIPLPQATAPELLAKMSAKEREADAARFSALQNWYMLYMLGDCVSRRDSEGVRALALTDIASAEEKAIIGRLQPQIAGCWSAGQTLRMSISDFRGPALRAYYHLASRFAAESDKSKEAAE